MKKTFAFLIAALLLLTCTSFAETVYTVDMIKEQGPGKLSDEPVTLSFFGGTLLKAQVRDNIDNILMTKWLEESTNVHIDWIVPAASEAGQNLNLMLSSGEYPDVIYGQELTTPQILAFAEQGILIPINQYLDEYAPEYKAVLENYDTIRNVVTAPGGNIYGFARTDGGLHVKCQNKLYAYTNWLNAYMDATGKEMPATTDELKEMLVYFRDHDMNGNGDTTDEIPMIGYLGDRLIDYLIAPFQVKPYDKYLDIQDGKVFAPFVTDAWKEGLRYINDLYNEGLLARDTFIQDANQCKILVSQPENMVVGCTGYNAHNYFFDPTAWPSGVNIYKEFTCLPPLRAEGYKMECANTDFSVNQCCFITSACKNPEIAVQWLNYWYTEEGMLVNYMGFEGILYEWVDQENLRGTKPALRDLQSIVGQHIDWYSSGNRLQTTELRYSATNDDTTAEYYNMHDMDLYMDHIEAESIPYTVWMTEEQANDLAMIESVIKGQVDKLTTEFIVGDKDVDKDWDSYLAELDSLGLQDWIDLYQTIMDAVK